MTLKNLSLPIESQVFKWFIDSRNEAWNVTETVYDCGAVRATVVSLESAPAGKICSGNVEGE